MLYVIFMPAKKKEEYECTVENGRTKLPPALDVSITKAGGLKAIVDGLPDGEILRKEASVHRALADPVRLRILHSLKGCEMCPCVLKEITGQSDSKLSYHLHVLEGAGLITSTPLKKWSIVALTDLGRDQVNR